MLSSITVPRIDCLLICASITTVGLYACAIWERSVRLRQNQMYIEAAIRIVDVLWNGAGGERRTLTTRARRTPAA
eukprot:2911776-Prymnesium_polylepis.1